MVIPDYVGVSVISDVIKIYWEYTDEVMGYADNFNWIDGEKIVADLAFDKSEKYTKSASPLFIAKGRVKTFYFAGMLYYSTMSIERIICIDEENAQRFKIVEEEE